MCNLSAVVACAFIISLSCIISGCSNNSTVVLEATDFALNKLNTLALASVSVISIVSELPLSLLIKILFITDCVAVGQVYIVVLPVDVKSAFAFLKLLAKEKSLCCCLVFCFLCLCLCCSIYLCLLYF